MIYTDATTSAVVDVVDRYRDRVAPVRFGDRFRVDASTVVTVDRVTLQAGQVVAVAGVTDDGRRVSHAIDADALRPAVTLADDVDRIRAAREVTG